MPTSHSDRPVICISVGDPRGIGPEVVEKSLKSAALKGKARFLVVGAPKVIKGDKRYCAKASIEAIDTAFKLIMDKRADAMVTGPVSKEAINNAGIRFAGHTEYLAGLCGVKKFAMMFISDKLKVSLVTRHIALSNVSSALSIKDICDTVELTYKALKNWFEIRSPKIGIAGINPHCGEEGVFGREEDIIIRPAIRRLRRSYKGIFGPVSGDALLYDVYHKRYDAAVCMYHDQGLAAFKMVTRDKGVNLTLGLPFIRTSPDHGTAFDIAGKGIANAGSMIEAIRLAIKLSRA